MNPSSPVLYHEVQYYRRLPPFTLIAAVCTLLGWTLVIWVGLMGRPLGRMQLTLPVALAIGLPLGVLVPLAYWRMRMVTEVLGDRLAVNTGMTGRVVLPYAEVKSIAVRRDSIHGDYNQRNVGALPATRTAYTVMGNDGVELELDDGRLIFIGSAAAEAFGAAVSGAWQAARRQAAEG